MRGPSPAWVDKCQSFVLLLSLDTTQCGVYACEWKEGGAKKQGYGLHEPSLWRVYGQVQCAAGDQPPVTAPVWLSSASSWPTKRISGAVRKPLSVRLHGHWMCVWEGGGEGECVGGGEGSVVLPSCSWQFAWCCPGALCAYARAHIHTYITLGEHT